MRVLIVDDDPASRHILAAHLRGLAETTLCASGPAAVAAVTEAITAENSFDAIFLDILMPEMDGHQTLVRIRQAERQAGLPPERHARVVMVTSVDDEANIMTALFDGQVAAYLVKPPNKAELLHKLELLGLL